MRENIVVFKINTQHSTFGKNVGSMGICKLGYAFYEFKNNSHNLILGEGNVELEESAYKILQNERFIVDNKLAEFCLKSIRKSSSVLEAEKLKNEELEKKVQELEKELAKNPKNKKD